MIIGSTYVLSILVFLKLFKYLTARKIHLVGYLVSSIFLNKE